MAKLTFSLDELIRILGANGILPGKIARLKAEGPKLRFIIKTGSFILPFVPASLEFQSFEDGKAIFELTLVAGALNKAASFLNRIFESKMPPYVKHDHPRLLVDIDKLLEEKNITGIRVTDICVEEDEFVVKTSSI